MLNIPNKLRRLPFPKGGAVKSQKVARKVAPKDEAEARKLVDGAGHIAAVRRQSGSVVKVRVKRIGQRVTRSQIVIPMPTEILTTLRMIAQTRGSAALAMPVGGKMIPVAVRGGKT